MCWNILQYLVRREAFVRFAFGAVALVLLDRMVQRQVIETPIFLQPCVPSFAEGLEVWYQSTSIVPRYRVSRWSDDAKKL